MTTKEYKSIICGCYCKSVKKKGVCANCVLNPALKNNFELSETAEALIKIDVLHNGSRLISEYVDACGKELCKSFEMRTDNNG